MGVANFCVSFGTLSPRGASSLRYPQSSPHCHCNQDETQSEEQICWSMSTQHRSHIRKLNPSSYKRRAYLFYEVNIMSAGVLTTQEARVYAIMIKIFVELGWFGPPTLRFKQGWAHECRPQGIKQAILAVNNTGRSWSIQFQENHSTTL